MLIFTLLPRKSPMLPAGFAARLKESKCRPGCPQSSLHRFILFTPLNKSCQLYASRTNHTAFDD